MSSNQIELTEKELREIYESMSKEKLVDCLVKRHLDLIEARRNNSNNESRFETLKPFHS